MVGSLRLETAIRASCAETDHDMSDSPRDLASTSVSGHDDVPLNMTRHTAIMAIGTALSRITGFWRLQATALALGITAMSDAYTLANNPPNIIYDLVIGGVLSATLVPVFVSLSSCMSTKMSCSRPITPCFNCPSEVTRDKVFSNF